jgi:hypothetical protein
LPSYYAPAKPTKTATKTYHAQRCFILLLPSCDASQTCPAGGFSCRRSNPSQSTHLNASAFSAAHRPLRAGWEFLLNVQSLALSIEHRSAKVLNQRPPASAPFASLAQRCCSPSCTCQNHRTTTLAKLSFPIFDKCFVAFSIPNQSLAV